MNYYEAWESGLNPCRRRAIKFSINTIILKKHKVLPLLVMTSSIMINGKTTSINASLICQRVIMSNDCSKNIKHYLTFKMAPFSASLFYGIGFLVKQ